MNSEEVNRFSPFYIRQDNHARVWPLKIKLIDDKIDVKKLKDNAEDFDNWVLDHKDEILSLIIQTWPNEEIKKGDIVLFEEIVGYRNDGLVIITEENQKLSINILSGDFDEYGHIPSNFYAITDYSPWYWKGILEHNRIIWLNENIWNLIKKSEILFEKESLGKNLFYVLIKYKDQDYKIKLDLDTKDSKKELIEYIDRLDENSYLYWDYNDPYIIRIDNEV